jgi:hypothetical protein
MQPITDWPLHNTLENPKWASTVYPETDFWIVGKSRHCDRPPHSYEPRRDLMPHVFCQGHVDCPKLAHQPPFLRLFESDGLPQFFVKKKIKINKKSVQFVGNRMGCLKIAARKLPLLCQTHAGCPTVMAQNQNSSPDPCGLPHSHDTKSN